MGVRSPGTAAWKRELSGSGPWTAVNPETCAAHAEIPADVRAYGIAECDRSGEQPSVSGSPHHFLSSVWNPWIMDSVRLTAHVPCQGPGSGTAGTGAAPISQDESRLGNMVGICGALEYEGLKLPHQLSEGGRDLWRLMSWIVI
jgi:hypothetical protein